MATQSIFTSKVLKAVKLIPKGKVASYGQVASMVGVPRAARQVGRVLYEHGGKNKIPWWRVINNNGYIVIKNPEHSPNEQKELLEAEGIKINKKLKIDIKKYRYIPTKKDLKILENDDLYIQLILRKFKNL